MTFFTVGSVSSGWFFNFCSSICKISSFPMFGKIIKSFSGLLNLWLNLGPPTVIFFPLSLRGCLEHENGEVE